jgi:hypothetical protein
MAHRSRRTPAGRAAYFTLAATRPHRNMSAMAAQEYYVRGINDAESNGSPSAAAPR